MHFLLVVASIAGILIVSNELILLFFQGCSDRRKDRKEKKDIIRWRRKKK